MNLDQLRLLIQGPLASLPTAFDAAYALTTANGRSCSKQLSTRRMAPVVCGLRTKNTLHTIVDGRRAQDLGAVALQIDLPIFHHPTQDDYVRVGCHRNGGRRFRELLAQASTALGTR
jgi:hypothetical protein